jgi:hypothetical protein
MHNSLHEKAVETTQQKRKKQGGRLYHMPKPEERGGMPQIWHCPHVEHHEDRNPKYHEEQQKDVA